MKILYILFFLLAPAFSFADVYKCNNSGVYSYSQSPCSSGSVAYREDLVTSGNSVSVPLGRNLVHNLMGQVNGRSVSFILDTGASATTLSGDTAYSMGVHSCETTSQSNSAGGLINLCSAVISRIEIAGAVFNNVTVRIAPTMRGQSLIGNDLLSRFRIEHHDGVMTLTR